MTRRSLRPSYDTRPWAFLLVLPFVVGGLTVSDWLAGAEPYLVLGLMLLLGLPHGATDQRLFQSMHEERRRHSRSFYLSYVGMIAGYALVWYLVPVVAFALFLLLALYHFGQSNWAHQRYTQPAYRHLHYLIWGAGVLLTPILLHYAEAASIVGSMTGEVVAIPPPAFRWGMVGLLALVNVLVIASRYRSGLLNARNLRIELVSYGLLLAVALTNSLLLSFTLYFVLWHSLGSLIDQFRFLRHRLEDFRVNDLIREVAPTVGGALLFCGYLWWDRPSSSLLDAELFGAIFVFISLLTLPHMLLVDRLYREWASEAETGRELLRQLR